MIEKNDDEYTFNQYPEYSKGANYMVGIELLVEIFHYLLIFFGIIGLIYSISDIKSQRMKTPIHFMFQWFSALVLGFIFLILPVNKIHIIWIYAILFGLAYTTIGELFTGNIIMYTLMKYFYPKNQNGGYSLGGLEFPSPRGMGIDAIELSKVNLTKEKIQHLMDTHQLKFKPSIDLQKAKIFFTSKIIVERKLDVEFLSTFYKNTKILLKTSSHNRNIKEQETFNSNNLEAISLVGTVPSMRAILNPLDSLMNFGPGPSQFERMDLFELAAKIAFKYGCRIFRDDFGYDEVEYSPEELLKYIR